MLHVFLELPTEGAVLRVVGALALDVVIDKLSVVVGAVGPDVLAAAVFLAADVGAVS